MKQKTSGADHVAKGWLVDRYRLLLEPLNMYVNDLKQMLYFQQGRFLHLSHIRCDYEGRRVRKDPPCFHMACPLCWHRATMSYLTKIAEAGQPTGLRIRTIDGVPPAVDKVEFVTHLTQGETPWVIDSRCSQSDVGALRLSVLSVTDSVSLDDGRQSIVLCGDESVAVTATDFLTVDCALALWFLEAPPPFAMPDYEDFVRVTKDFDFGKCIYEYPIKPRYATSPEVDSTLLDL